MTDSKVTAVAQVETKAILPRTLEVVGEQMKVAGADATMYVCYGKDEHDRKIWCATFIDSDEAMAWIHGSKVFGRPVTGAVLAGQEKKVEKSLIEVSDGSRIADREPADKPN